MVDSAYPIFMKFSKHLIELQGLIAYSQFQEIYSLIDKYLGQEFQSPYITFMLEEFQGEIGTILQNKHQKLLTQQQRKTVIKDYIVPDAVPYLAHTKVESYSRKQKILKLKLENGRQFVMFGNNDTKIDAKDFDVVREILGEFNSPPILIAEDLPVQKIQKKEITPIIINDKIIDKNLIEALSLKIDAYQHLGFKTHLQGEELYSFVTQYLQPHMYDIDFASGNVWIHKKGQSEFHTLATAYVTYINSLKTFGSSAKPEIYLCKLPKQFQNNELSQRYTLNQMQEMLLLCKYTQLLESSRYMHKYQDDTIELPCPSCNKQFKVKAPPLPKGYMDVMSGDNLYSLTRRDNFFVQSLAKVLRQTKQNALIITSNRNFYNAVASVVSNGECIPERKEDKLFFDFANIDLDVGRLEYLKFMNLLIGKGSNSGALVKEYYEKQTILDVLDNYDASVTESRESDSTELFKKYAYILSWDKVLEALPEKDREVLKARSKKETTESCFIESSTFHSGKKRMITSSKSLSTDENLKSEFQTNLKKLCGIN